MESELAAESHPAKLSTSLLAFSFAITLTILPFPVLGRPVNTIAEAAVENTLTPGVAVAILHHGSIVYEAGFGTAGPNNARVTPATRFAMLADEAIYCRGGTSIGASGKAFPRRPP